MNLTVIAALTALVAFEKRRVPLGKGVCQWKEK